MINDARIQKDAKIQTSKFAAGRDVRGLPTQTYPIGQRSVGALVAPRYSGGLKAQNTLRLAANVANTETVTIGPLLIDGLLQTDVYQIDVVAAATGVNTSGGQWNNTNDPILVTIAAHGLSAGDLVRTAAEIEKVLRVIDANNVVVARGRCGTTNVVHADGVAILKSATPPASNIPVGNDGTLTPAVNGPALAAEIVNAVCATSGERATAKASKLFKRITAVSLQAGAEVLVYGRNPEVNVAATTETLAGANNAWQAAAMFGGAEPAAKKTVQMNRVPTAQEIALGFMRFPVDFQPGPIDVVILTTATGVALVWDGARTSTFSAAAGGIVSLDNAGAADWTAAMTVYVTVHEL